MNLSFSSDELKNILKQDTGFKNVLNSMPDSQASWINQMLSDGNTLVDLLKMLPENIRSEIEPVLNSIIHTPQKAQKLYKECRFFEARKLLQESISLYSNIPSILNDFLNNACTFVAKRVNALFFNLLGEVEWELGNKEQAEKNHQAALKIAKEIDDIDTIAKSFYGLGVYHWNLGDFEKAEKFNLKALKIITGHDDQWFIQNKIFTNLGAIYSDMGQYDKALDYSQNAVELCDINEDYKSFPISCNNLACIYIDMEEFDLAIETLENGLTVVQNNNDIYNEILILNNIAVCFLKKDSNERSIKLVKSFLSQALSIMKTTDSKSLRALTILNSGFAHHVAGEKNDAKKYFVDAINIYRETGSKSNEAQALNTLALHLEDCHNDIQGAFKAYEKSIKITENIRGTLSKEIHRITYADREIEPYEKIVNCLLMLKQPQKAIEYVERAKSRTLLEFLSDKLLKSQNRTGFNDIFDKAATLLKKIDELQLNLNAVLVKEEIDFVLRDDKSQYNKNQNYKQSLINDLEKNEHAFNEAYSHLIKKNPEMASLLKEEPIKSNNSHIILDNETFLLNLFQTEKALHVFIQFPDSHVSQVTIDIPEDEALTYVNDLTTAIKNPATFDIRSHEYIRKVQQPLSNLYDKLIQYLEPLFDKYKRIIISPHLFWHYFPFHALYNKNEGIYLCDQVEISYCPSASVLYYCMTKNKLKKESAIILSKNKGDLEHVDKETDLIAAAFQSKSMFFSGKDAYLSKINKTDIPYDIIHLACHGYFNHNQPFLSGIDIPPEQNDEGRTYLLDFFNLKFNCNLVTISACESGLNIYTRADELVGLNRALFCTGAASVMLSLWNVVDESTCDFMENFYWHYISNRQIKTRAMQLAMQAVKSTPEYAHPYFWAPFVVMGDWR